MIFLRKIVPGAADESYGVEVANLAGLPGSVITRARQLLQELEAGAAPAQPVEKPEADQVSMLDYVRSGGVPGAAEGGCGDPDAH